MLRLFKRVVGLQVEAMDGLIGKVTDLYPDETNWKIRYLVIDAVEWLPGRRVLLAPAALRTRDFDVRTIRANLNRETVRNSPPIGHDEPVSLAHDEAVARYFGWPGVSGEFAPVGPEIRTEARKGAHLLHRLSQIIGWHVRAHDGETGHVDEAIVDDEQWAIRYLVLDTSNLPGGKPVLLPLELVASVDWRDRKVIADAGHRAIVESPKFELSQLNRDFENSLYEHYGRPGYWRAA